MKKKQVLVFIDWFRPGFKAGGPVQSLDNLAAHLSGEIDFYIVTRDTDYCEDQPYTTITPDAWNTLQDGLHVYYISAGRLNKDTFKTLIKERNYDRYYINGIYSRYFSILPLQLLQGSGKKLVLAPRGMLAGSAIAIKSGKKKLFLAMAKLLGYYREVVFHATSAQEVLDIRKVFGDKPVVLLAENLPRKRQSQPAAIAKQPGELRLLCLARIAPEKNNLYAIEVLKKATQRITIDFFGTAYDSEYAAQCRKAAAELPANVTAAFHEPVPSEEVPELLAKYHALLLPTRGENFGHVILEALSCGRPVLISDQTPWRGLKDKKAGYDLALNKPEAFTEVIESWTKLSAEEFAAWQTGALKTAEAFSSGKNLVEASRRLFAD